MGNAYFGSKATAGLCQPLIALMPHSVYIQTHLGGGAIMKRKPAALHNIGIDLNPQALSQFDCNYPVELVRGCCHRFLADHAFDGTERCTVSRPTCSARASRRGATVTTTTTKITRRCWACCAPCRARRWCRATRRRSTTSGCPVGAACRCR